MSELRHRPALDSLPITSTPLSWLVGLAWLALGAPAHVDAQQLEEGVHYFNLQTRNGRGVRLRETDPCFDAVSTLGGLRYAEVPRMRGLTERHVRRCFGRPARRRGEVWTYQLFSPGCSEWAREIEVRFRAGRVVRARSRRFGTGEHCSYPF